MIALATTTDKGECISAMGVAYRVQALGNVTQGLLPAHTHKATVRLALQGVGEAVGVVLVIVQARGLVAQIALGAGMRRVTTDFFEVAALHFHFKATVAGTQNAGGFGGGHGNAPNNFTEHYSRTWFY